METRPAQLLRQVFCERKRNNPKYSLRAFARDLQVSHGYLSLLLNEKKALHPRRAALFAQRLRLEGRASQCLLQAASQSYLSRALHVSPRSRKRAAEFLALDLERFRVWSEWHHVAILDLTALSSFQPRPPWIARQLGISVSEVKEAVHRLKRLGLLEASDQKWRKVQPLVRVDAKVPARATYRYHKAMLEKAGTALKRRDLESFRERHIVTSSIAIDISRLPEAKRRVERFRRNLLLFLSRGNASHLFQLNIQLFPLTRDVKERRKRAH